MLLCLVQPPPLPLAYQKSKFKKLTFLKKGEVWLNLQDETFRQTGPDTYFSRVLRADARLLWRAPSGGHRHNSSRPDIGCATDSAVHQFQTVEQPRFRPHAHAIGGHGVRTRGLPRTVPVFLPAPGLHSRRHRQDHQQPEKMARLETGDPPLGRSRRRDDDIRGHSRHPAPGVIPRSGGDSMGRSGRRFYDFQDKFKRLPRKIQNSFLYCSLIQAPRMQWGFRRGLTLLYKNQQTTDKQQ